MNSKYKQQFNNKKGFISDNLEIVVAAVFVIGVLGSVLFFFSLTFKRSKDIQRKGDLRILQRAINEHENNYGQLPGEPNKTYEGRIKIWIPDLFIERRVALPQDPETGKYDYRYRHDGTSFELDAYLEVLSKDMTIDGGNNNQRYETGTNLKILD